MESKTLNIHLLPTNITEWSGQILIECQGGFDLRAKHMCTLGFHNPMYMYFTVNETVKYGDWILRENDGIYKPTQILNESFNGKTHPKKIVGSTDPNVIVDTGSFEPDGTATMIKLPQIPYEFQQTFCNNSSINTVDVQTVWVNRIRGVKPEDREYDIKIDNNNLIILEHA